MTDIQLTSELLQTLKNIQEELQQMNKALSTIAAAKAKPATREFEGRPSTGRPSAGRQFEGRPAGRSTGRDFEDRPAGKSSSTTRVYRSEKSEGSSASAGPRYGAKKSPSRSSSKGGFPPKKGSGYPKKPR